MSSIDDIVLGTFSHVFDFGIIPLAPAASVTLEVRNISDFALSLLLLLL